MADSNEDASVNIQIPQSLYRKIEQRAQEAEFDSVDAYVAFVLEEVAAEDESVLSAEDEEKVKERLRNLGYL